MLSLHPQVVFIFSRVRWRFTGRLLSLSISRPESRSLILRTPFYVSCHSLRHLTVEMRSNQGASANRNKHTPTAFTFKFLADVRMLTLSNRDNVPNAAIMASKNPGNDFSFPFPFRCAQISVNEGPLYLLREMHGLIHLGHPLNDLLGRLLINITQISQVTLVHT